MASVRSFSLQIDSWVIWSCSDWKDGWINLRTTPAKMSPGERRKVFMLGWNGKRFAEGTELKKLRKYASRAEHILQEALATDLPRTIH